MVASITGDIKRGLWSTSVVANITGDILISAGSVAYLGPFTVRLRVWVGGRLERPHLSGVCGLPRTLHGKAQGVGGWRGLRRWWPASLEISSSQRGLWPTSDPSW